MPGTLIDYYKHSTMIIVQQTMWLNQTCYFEAALIDPWMFNSKLVLVWRILKWEKWLVSYETVREGRYDEWPYQLSYSCHDNWQTLLSIVDWSLGPNIGRFNEGLVSASRLCNQSSSAQKKRPRLKTCRGQFCDTNKLVRFQIKYRTLGQKKGANGGKNNRSLIS